MTKHVKTKPPKKPPGLWEACSFPSGRCHTTLVPDETDWCDSRRAWGTSQTHPQSFPFGTTHPFRRGRTSVAPKSPKHRLCRVSPIRIRSRDRDERGRLLASAQSGALGCWCNGMWSICCILEAKYKHRRLHFQSSWNLNELHV